MQSIGWPPPILIGPFYRLPQMNPFRRPLIYPPGMVLWTPAQQNVCAQKLFSENPFRCEILWLVPHALEKLGERRGPSGECKNCLGEGVQGTGPYNLDLA